MSSQPEFVDQVRRDFSGLLSRFQEAWEGEGEPEVSDFLAMEANDDREVRHQLLLELLKIDLASRWQQSVPKGGDIPVASGMNERTLQLPRIERYIVEWPEIGPADSVDIELIVHEYRIRQRFGDRPDLQEYGTRFPNHGETLSVSLGEVETEFRKMREGSTAPGMDVASVETNRAMGTLLPGAGGSEPATEIDKLPADAGDQSAGVKVSMGNFGNYDLQEELGRGAMGIVYRARQLRPDRPVALKTISKGKLASVEQVRTFFAEADSAGNLRHPHIVTVYDSGEVDGQHYFSMAYIEGKSLDEILEPGETLDPKRAAAYIRTTAEAIEYAHSMGVLHRDLKPGNVLIDEKDEPHVADFGIASRMEDDATSPVHGEVVGTPSYMPPEQAQGRADLIGPASDVYSLGATLYFLLTGVPPFGGGDVMATLMQVIEDSPSPPRKFNRSVDRYLQAICLKCLAKNPGDRYASAQELADDLGRYLRNEPTVALSPPMVIRFAKWCRRNPAVARLVVVILLILLGTSGGFSILYFQLVVANGDFDAVTAEAGQAVKDRDKNKVLAGINKTMAEKNATLAKKYEDDAKKNEDLAEKHAGLAKKHADLAKKSQVALEMAEKDLEPLQDELVAKTKKLADAKLEVLKTQKQADEKQKELVEKQKELVASNSKLAVNLRKLSVQELQFKKLVIAEREQLKSAAVGQRKLGKTYRKLDENENAKKAFTKSIEASLVWAEKAREIPVERRKALLDVAESSRLLGELHANLEELEDATRNFELARQKIAELRKDGMNSEEVQFCNAQLLNSRSIVLGIQGRLKNQLTLLHEARDAYKNKVLTQSKSTAKKRLYTQELARTHRILGITHYMLGRENKKEERNEVFEQYNEAIRLLEGLHSDSDGDQEFQLSVIQDLSQTLQNRSGAWQAYAFAARNDPAENRKRMERATRDCDESIKWCELLLTKAPNNQQYKVDWSYAWIARAAQYPKEQADVAEKRFRSEISAIEGIVERNPIPDYRRLLATARELFASLYLRSASPRQVLSSVRLKLGLEQYDAALKERERLYAQFKNMARYRHDLAKTLLRVALARRKAQDGPRAAEAIQSGSKHIKELCEDFPERSDYRLLELRYERLNSR